MEPINVNELRYSILTEEDLVTLKGLKNILVKSQLYHEAAVLRDLEKRMMEIIELGKIHGYPTERYLDKWRKELYDGQKFYSKTDVNNLIELTSKPLKDALAKYEESVRHLIDKNITGLITQIHEKDAIMQDTMLDFAQFILERYVPYNYISNGLPSTNYRLIDDSGWDGEPSKIYTCKEVYNEFLQHKNDEGKKKREEEINDAEPLGGHWVISDDSGTQHVYVGGQKMNLVCEHDNCVEQYGRDYKRVPNGGEMDNEPIFLCDSHATGFEPFTT
jgi:hypothetical protein